MDSSTGALQAAVYTRLTSDSTLMAAIKGVFDFTPQNQNFPYVVIGEDVGTDASTFGADGEEVACTIHTWSMYQGFSEVKSIHSLILQSLTAPLTVNGWNVITLRVDLNQAIVDADGITRHGILRIRFYASK